MSVPIRVRLTLWFTTLLALILVLVGVLVAVNLRAALTRALDGTLRTSASEIAADYMPVARNSESEFSGAIDASLAGLPRDASAAQIVSPGGSVVVSAGNGQAASPMLPPASISAAVAGATSMQTAVVNGQDYRVYATPFTDEGKPSALIVATSLEDVEGAIHRLVLILAVVIPPGVLVAALGGWWLAKKALRPVATMIGEARAIDASRLDDRVEIPAAMDEVGQLAVTLNEMLDRIQTSVEQQQAFVSNASHELRSPLAIMRTEIDVSLVSGDLSDEAREVLESAREETDRMRAIVEDLVVLAQMDEGALAPRAERVDLAGLAEGVLTAMSPQASARAVRLEFKSAGPVEVIGDADRLRHVVRNLVDNAIKYSPRGGRVVVDVHRDEHGGELTVVDAGPGIPAVSIPRIFDRFYRADEARSREAGGSGLGLAIVRELVEGQGGRVWVRSDGSGAMFGCVLRLAATDPAPAKQDA